MIFLLSTDLALRAVSCRPPCQAPRSSLRCPLPVPPVLCRSGRSVVCAGASFATFFPQVGQICYLEELCCRNTPTFAMRWASWNM